MKALTAIVIVFISVVFLAIVPIFGDKHNGDGGGTLSLSETPLHSYEKSFKNVGKEFGIVDKNMTSSPHRVTFHIIPEKEGVSVVAWASDSLPPTNGETDKNSEVTFNLLSTVKYNILIGGNKCSYYIYPTDDYYDMECKI